MAGDTGVEEMALLLPPTTNIQTSDVVRIVAGTGGRVIHIYGPRLFIVRLTPEAEESVLLELEGAELGSNSLNFSNEAKQDLDPTGSLGLAAFDLRQSEEYVHDKISNRPHNGEPWNGPGVQPPDIPLPPGVEPPVFPRGQRLIGRVAVGVVIVSGLGNLEFTAEEMSKVSGDVQNGLTWLNDQCPGPLTWFHEVQIIRIDVAPNPDAPDKEGLWRNPAMEQLGFEPNIGAVSAYTRQLKDNYRALSAYVAYFTKYPIHHYAYVSGPTPHVVMDYANDGWDPKNIDGVFTHETCHIFNAQDEYAPGPGGGTPCYSCEGQFGYYGERNGNCRTCAPEGGVDCIMDGNTFALCRYTPWQLGFPWPQAVGINATDNIEKAPTLCQFKDELYLFWNETADGWRIRYSRSNDGLTWPAGRLLNGRGSYGGPAVTEFKERLYASYGVASLIWMVNSSDGETWSDPPDILDFPTRTRHTTCVFNKLMYLVFLGIQAIPPVSGRDFKVDPKTIQFASFDGQRWSKRQALPNTTEVTQFTPVVCVFRSKMYVFWTETKTNRIYYSTSTDGVEWSAAAVINITARASCEPTAYVFNDQLALFWLNHPTGSRVDNPKFIMFSISRDGKTWPTGQVINEVDITFQAPGVACFSDDSHMKVFFGRLDKRLVFTPGKIIE